MGPVIRVIGYDGSPVADQLLAGATLVMGGERHLAAARIPVGARTLVLGDVVDGVRALLAHAGPAVVLASGDPGFFGIVRRLRAAGAEVEVHPAVSSLAQAFARAGIEWDDATVVSAHGRDSRPALAVVRTGGKVAVLTDQLTGPAEVAAAAPAEALLMVAERLGEPDERVTFGSPAQIAAGSWREPNVVLVLDGGPPAPPPWRVGGEPPAGGWGLPVDAFEHRDGMVTKPEVRALALARLGPRPGTVVWDVGAGSGSVGIECARLGAAAVLVERDPEQAARARRNADVHGVRVQVVQAPAPAALAGLPEPDAVFVGGGGAEVITAVAGYRPARVVVALAQLERVPSTLAALAGYDVDTVLLQVSRLQPLGEGSRLVPATPIFLVTGVLS